MNRNIGRGMLAVMCVGIAMIGGCKSSEKTQTQASPSVMNTACPFSGKPVAEGMNASYEGKTVGFCCKGCASKFDSMSTAEKQAKMANVK
jgi:YHS domain-containing protein